MDKSKYLINVKFILEASIYLKSHNKIDFNELMHTYRKTLSLDINEEAFNEMIGGLIYKNVVGLTEEGEIAIRKGNNKITTAHSEAKHHAVKRLKEKARNRIWNKLKRGEQ